MDLVALFQLAAPALARATLLTLGFAVAAMVCGLLLGAVVATVRVLEVPGLQQVARVYVSLFRGTPLLVQVFVIYYGLPSVGLEFTPTTAGVLALALNVAAYLSEGLRGGFSGVGRGQWLAGASLGLTRVQTMRHVIAPQALRIAVPSLSNSLIGLIKDTSLISVIAVTELMLATKELISTTFQPFPLYLAAAAIYWVLSLSFERVQHWMEQRLAFPNA